MEKNIKSSYNNNKFKISASKWIQIFKIHFKNKRENIDKPSVQIYLNKIERRITLKIKDGYNLEHLTPGTMKLLGNTENKTIKDKSGENVPQLEIKEVVLVQCNIINNDYQQDFRVLYTFVPKKPFGSLLDIFPTSHIFIKHSTQSFKQSKYGLLIKIVNY